jgi:hypothetical protein
MQEKNSTEECKLAMFSLLDTQICRLFTSSFIWQLKRKTVTSLQKSYLFILLFFSTNLKMIFVKFEKSLDKSTLALCLNGLRNILSIAAQYDVVTIAIPALLIEPEFKHLFSNTQLVKRVESLLKSIRAFLSERQMFSDHSLKTIQFVVPSTAQTILNEIQRLFTAVTNSNDSTGTKAVTK